MAASGEKRHFFKNGSFARNSENVSEIGCLSVIVLGASGDLAKKKTFPALFNLYKQGFLQLNDVHIFGYSRTKLTDDELRVRIQGYLAEGKETSNDVSNFLRLNKYVSGSYDSPDGFQELDEAVSEHERSKNSAQGSYRILFYLALPPSVYPQVCKMIKNHCMNKSDLGGWTRIVVEKPFGKDLASAEELSSQIVELFDESQIYRIYHYLGKELVQNLLVLRFANRFFLPLWNRDNIANVQIVFREDFGTEGRGGYFDQYGIVRDIIQNHLLQVFCLVAMEKPISMKPEHIRDEKVKVLRSVIPMRDDEVVLGQYQGYKDDPTVPDGSNTPTFATMILRIHNERWEGDQQHFVRRDELKAAWEIFTPLLHRIDERKFESVAYEPGSRGPAEADRLLEKAGYVQTHGYIWIPPTL
ncbi:hypothetical protein ACS0TY_028110 [Phlomoides rotata]